MMIFGLMILAAASLPGEDEASSVGRGDITVVVTELRNDRGEVLISLYNKAEGFPRDRSTIIRTSAVKPDDSGQVTAVFEDLPLGEYAIACLHDEDRSQGMTFGMLHLPKEGYCFSNNVKVRLRAPRFDKAKFVLEGDKVTQTLKMRY
jgi:uncharacterized protein (DUF2141 family)